MKEIDMNKKIRVAVLFALFVSVMILTSQPIEAQEPKKILSIEAYDMLNTVPDTYLIDVRTRAEYQFVGHPINAYLFPFMFLTQEFVKQDGKHGYRHDAKNKAFVQEIGKVFKKTDNLYRQGRRLLGAEGKKGFQKAMNNEYFLMYGDAAPPIVPGELKGVIMGHNHRHVLRMISSNGEEKFYANTGTWKPVVEIIDDDPRNGFARRIELGYITIEMISNEFLVQSKHIKKLSGLRLSEDTIEMNSEGSVPHEIGLRV